MIKGKEARKKVGEGRTYAQTTLAAMSHWDVSGLKSRAAEHILSSPAVTPSHLGRQREELSLMRYTKRVGNTEPQ